VQLLGAQDGNLLLHQHIVKDPALLVPVEVDQVADKVKEVRVIVEKGQQVLLAVELPVQLKVERAQSAQLAADLVAQV
jgi:hypothetical protein